MTQTPRHVVVTGGSAGIGRAICETLLAQGHAVLSLDRDAPTLAHERFTAHEVDLADRAAVARACREIVAPFAPTVVVHNAGAIRSALIADVRLEDVDALTQLHLTTAVQLVQAALPSMRAARHGRIVLVSTRAVLGLATRTAYSATKAALLGLARTWALELGADGITANAVAPGPIRTPMFHAVVDAGSERERALAASIPVKRLGEAEDVARAVAFFTDEAAGFVTGQTLYVCGGTSVGSLAL